MKLSDHGAAYNGVEGFWFFTDEMKNFIDYLHNDNPRFTDRLIHGNNPSSTLLITSINYQPTMVDLVPDSSVYIMGFDGNKVSRRRAELTINVRPSDNAEDGHGSVSVYSFHPFIEFDVIKPDCLEYYNKLIELIENKIHASVEELTNGAFRYL